MPEGDSSTIEDYVDEYRDLELSFETIHYKELDKIETNNGASEKMILLSDSILEKYQADLDELVETKTFTSKEQYRYDCNPWALSYDLYGTVEFWHLLLELNGMYSITEFTRNTIKVYDASLPDVIGAILALEEESINQNNEEIEDQENEVDPDDYDESDSDDDIEETGDDSDDEYEEDDEEEDSDEE